MFFSRSKGPKVRDVMYMDEQACAAAVQEWLQVHPAGRVGIWFQQDLEHFRSLLPADVAGRLALAQRLSFTHLAAGDILFVGHYPLRSVETGLYEELGLAEPLVYGHLDMPFMRLFGSERIKDIMVKMGMQPREAVEHSMISAAIKNALDKISSKVPTDIPARSEEEWLRFAGEFGS